MKIHAGKMRSEVTIEQLGTPGGLGQAEYVTFTAVRGELQTTSGREIIAGHMVGSDESHVLITRYIPGVTAKMRLRIGTRIFIIKNIAIMDESKARLLNIFCREVLA